MSAARTLGRVLGVVGVGVVAFAGVLVANAMRIRPLAIAPPPELGDLDVDPRRAADHLGAAIRFRTISHDDPAQDDMRELDGLVAWLATTYPNAHRTATVTPLPRGVLLRWAGTDVALSPSLFAAHLDVVPIEDEKAWSHPPFGGASDGGFVWGRGALDDKGAVVALLEAMESLTAHGFIPRRTLYFAFGGDEEVGGARGAKLVAERLGHEKIEYVLDEGLSVTDGIVPNVARPVALIGIAEKGFTTVDLDVAVEGGHSSMPPRESAIGILARAVDRLEQAPMPARLAPPTRRFLEALAPEVPLGQKMALGNLWLFEPLIVSMLEKTPATNAAVRTTTAPTLFSAGIKDNVLAAHATAAVNFRILPGDTVEAVVAHVREVVADPRVVVKTTAESHDPSRTSSPDARAFGLIAQAIHGAFPDAVVAPSLVLGATDGRHYEAIAGDVYRFVPFVFRPEDLARVHGVDERVSVDGLGAAIRMYAALLRDAP